MRTKVEKETVVLFNEAEDRAEIYIPIMPDGKTGCRNFQNNTRMNAVRSVRMRMVE